MRDDKDLKVCKDNTILTREGVIQGGFEDTKNKLFGKPTAQEIGILSLPLWNLTKCYSGEIINGLQINYGNKNITILITDDLYLELKKLTETPKEDKTSNE